VVLRPDGIRADKVTGEIFVPWEALAPAQPGPGDDPRELDPGLLPAGADPHDRHRGDRTSLEFEGAGRGGAARAGGRARNRR
jgi:hypothetical protein